MANPILAQHADIFCQRMRQDHRSPTRRQILLMHDANSLKRMPHYLELGARE